MPLEAIVLLTNDRGRRWGARWLSREPQLWFIDNVWVAEAWKDGERIERVVHKNKHDAREDIEVCTALDDPDRIDIERERLWLGSSNDWHITR